MEKIIQVLRGQGAFRFTLAFLVVVFHAINAFPIGHYAVYVFFILSGYWIVAMYEKKYSQQPQPISRFYKSRLLRLVFIYWVILLVAIPVFFYVHAYTYNISWKQFSLLEILTKNIGLLGINTSPIMFLVPAWSLEVEIQFYLTVPFLVLALKYIRVQTLLSLSLVGLIAYLLLVPETSRFPNLLLYLPFFLIGAAIYRNPKQASVRWSNLCLLAGLAILVLGYALPQTRSAILERSEPLFGLNDHQDQLNLLLALLTVPFLSRHLRTRASFPNTDQRLSSMSFVLYLLHWPLLRLYTVWSPEGQMKLFWLLGYFAVAIVTSWLISTYVDSPLEQWRKKWLDRSAKSAAVEHTAVETPLLIAERATGK